MTVTAKILVEAKFIEAVDTAQYAATGVTTILDRVTITNVSATPATASFNLVPPLGIVLSSNVVMRPRVIQPGECYLSFELMGQVLAPGGSISGIAGTAAALVLRISGREIS